MEIPPPPIHSLGSHRQFPSTYLGYRRHEIATCSWLELIDYRIGGQSSHPGNALHILVGEVGLPLLLPLCQGNIQWLGAHDAPIHFCYGFGGFLWRGKADEAKTFASTVFQHHLGKESSL